MKVTPWFDGEIKPVRKGVYQLFNGTQTMIGYQYWDGEYWYEWDVSPEIAAKIKWPAASCFQNDKWRGIAK